MTTINRDDDPQSGGSGAQTQAETARLRETVLDGRGPGASTSEVLAHTRGRRTVGGYPVAALRDEVARASAAARRDPDGLALHLAGDRRRLAADLDVLVPRLRPQRLLGQAGRRTRQVRRRSGLAVLLLVTVLLFRRLRRR